jgi:hypothetical protein
LLAAPNPALQERRLFYFNDNAFYLRHMGPSGTPPAAFFRQKFALLERAKIH